MINNNNNLNYNNIKYTIKIFYRTNYTTDTNQTTFMSHLMCINVYHLLIKAIKLNTYYKKIKK